MQAGKSVLYSLGKSLAQLVELSNLLRAMMPNSRAVILIGFMGSGKSSIGTLLAKRLGWMVCDTDEMIVARAGETVAEIFARRGEAAFREMENQLLQELDLTESCVVTTGGGIILHAENRERLRSLGTVAWLKVDAKVLLRRLAGARQRPLLQTNNPAATIAELLKAREEFYRQTAHLILETSLLTADQAAEEILLLLNQP